MGCKKQLFGEKRNCKGVVPESAASQSTETTKVVVSTERTGQGDVALPAGITEAGTSSCTPVRNDNVDAGISEAGASSSRCIFSPMATLTAREIATPDAEKKYTHMKKKMDERMLLIEKEKAKRNVVNCSEQ